MKRFQLSLNTTRTIFNGIKNISSYGYTEFTIIINDPPENGSCSILGFIKKDQKWLDTSVGLGLVQEFKLNCDNKWVDPNGHKILEYVFKSKWVIPRGKKPISDRVQATLKTLQLLIYKDLNFENSDSLVNQ